ncbi:hypothetical protein J4E83_009116 [Alternaria metachromatica]|uniref:uncharacterized protein n=1 Tax=Alternaria metachromatica TaxID=283354 RepID=UPI0020C334B1|nr:uncharacterized protein J4E83_009116 [Alternaria metachromatica]KAI4608314.1 hypothetical protein J4E83_009116 [Alternaria metachromatica]
MRLLYTIDDEEIAWTEDIIRSEDIPCYAILSHTWGKQEVTFDDLRSVGSMRDVEAKNEAIAKKREGWDKIRFCAAQAKRDDIDHFWVDTCCIDKANNTELSEAINSMFRWYQRSDRCYVYLPDVEGKPSAEDDMSSSGWRAAFKASRWFTRGWTLQELIAPRSVQFFSADGSRLGNKESLKQTIHEVTGIPVEALSGGDLSKFDITERLSWAQNRHTTREEDSAYCLLGIVGCHLPLIYGEGKESALKRLGKEIQGYPESVAGASANDIKAHKREQEEKLIQIHSWLSAPDPSTNYRKAHDQRQAGTGLWLLNSGKFKKWKEAPASQLWLYGIPGCGKTILSSTVIEHLLKHCADDVRKVTIYFYFDFNDAQKQDAELMLRSLLCQLLRHAGVITKDFDALFASSGNGLRYPSVHEFLEVLPEVIRQFTDVYMVLDALDECTQRPELMDMLGVMAGWQLDNVHVLMTSRKERNIEKSLKGHMEEDDAVCLQRAVVDEDILRYVQQRLRDDQGLAKWNNDVGIKREIETALMHGARGISLAKCRNLAMLRKSLATLPQTLDQTYDRVFAAISEQDRVYAMRILQWLTFSARPLSVEEVAEVVAIDDTRETVFNRDEVLVDPLEALEICSSLVVVTDDYRVERQGQVRPGLRIVALAHYSVQEYLVSDRIKQGPAKDFSMQSLECHKAMTKGTLGYLYQFQQPIAEGTFNLYALVRYSAEFWSHHLKSTGDAMEEMSQSAMHLFSRESPALITWIRVCDPESFRREPDLKRGRTDGEGIRTPLYYGALLGLSTITKNLLDQGAEINVPGGNYGNPLQAASALGYKTVVELLIKAGADVNAKARLFGNPLQAASAGGHAGVAKLLIDAGAHINATSAPLGSALDAALDGGHESTARLLLERGANAGLDEQLRGTSTVYIFAGKNVARLWRFIGQHRF